MAPNSTKRMTILSDSFRNNDAAESTRQPDSLLSLLLNTIGEPMLYVYYHSHARICTNSAVDILLWQFMRQ
jgi:hypothetical protein